MQDHTNYRPAKCTMCEKSFKNKQDLASHIRCHKDIRKYMCDVCGKRFRSQSHMVYHRYSHFEERNFHCDLCTQSFKSPHILRTHRNTVHSKIFRYECEECGRKFKRDHHLIVSASTEYNCKRQLIRCFHFHSNSGTSRRPFESKNEKHKEGKPTVNRIGEQCKLRANYKILFFIYTMQCWLNYDYDDYEFQMIII